MDRSQFDIEYSNDGSDAYYEQQIKQHLDKLARAFAEKHPTMLDTHFILGCPIEKMHRTRDILYTRVVALVPRNEIEKAKLMPEESIRKSYIVEEIGFAVVDAL